MRPAFEEVSSGIYNFWRKVSPTLAGILLTIPTWLPAQSSQTELVATIRRLRHAPTAQQVIQYPKLIRQWELKKFPEDSVYVAAHIDLAHLLFVGGNPGGGLIWLKKALSCYQMRDSTRWDNDLLKIYYRIAFYHQALNQLVTAQTVVQNGFRAATMLPPNKWRCALSVLMAHLHYQSGDYEKALSAAEQAVRYSRLIQYDYGISDGNYQIAKALYGLQRYAEAQKALLSSIHLAEKSPQRQNDLVVYYRTLAYVDKAIGDTLQGIRNFNKAVGLLKIQRDSLSIGDTSIDLGFFLYELQRYHDAIKPLEDAIRIHPSPYGRARAYDNLGAVYWQLKQYPKALQTYQKGLVGLPLRVGTSIDALPTAADIRLLPYKEYIFTLILDKADTWLDYARSTNNPAHYRNALKTYALVDEVIDLMRREHTGTGSKLYWRQKTRPIYERAIETSFRLRDSVQAFRFFEKSRAVLLTDKLNELGARQQLSPAQIAQEQGLMQQVSQYQTELSGQRTSTPAYETARTKLLNAQDKLDEFRQQLEKTNQAYYQLRYDNSIRSLPEVQQWLGDREASLLTYFVGEQQVYALGIRPSGVVFHQIPAPPYRKTADDFMQRLVDGQRLNQEFGKFVQASNSLYKQLIQPLNLPAGRVVVTPDGSFIPFEALSRSARQPDYLVKNYAFSYAYSANVLLKQRPPAQSNRDFLGLAPVSFAPKLNQASLSGSDAVLNQVGALFGKPVLLTGPAATRRAFVGQASQYRVIQLFTHADADSSGREPVIYFADSTLRLSELETGSLPNVELLGLSACKTGVGTARQGEGVFSLARGFASLGVPSILPTLWSVESRATYDLTERFYEYCAEGLPKDVALQRARLDYLQTADRSGSLPDHWAGLILVGNSEPLEIHRFRWWWVAGIAGLFFIALTGWRLRRKKAVVY